MDEIRRHRELLPIFPAKIEIIQAVNKEDNVIFVAETACGKTTQIPQYLFEAGFSRKKIIGITQPRRVAAITIAERVALEVGTELGGKVGYTIRFEDVTSSATKIKYLTDGCLLRESISDPLLMNYSVIILDEAHERTVHTDILFGIVKSAQLQRKQKLMMPLKVVIMSATMDYNHFSEYFNNATAYSISGRKYSIDVFHSSKKQEEYVHSALVAVFQIHQTADDGDILVFCTGQEEIETLVQDTKEIAKNLKPGCRMVIACPLFSALPSEWQLEAFKPTPKGCRKVIYSTNIAETSVTIPGIKYVIDTGMVKAKIFNPTSGIHTLKAQRISKEQAEQRMGRAGREGHGYCYRLYTMEEYNNFQQAAIPEIQRCNLGSVILQIIALGIKNVREFDFLDRPSDASINGAVELLKLLKAVTEVDGGLELTECGRKMAHFPLDPKFSKMIVTSKQLRCTDEILSIISLLSVNSLFFVPPSKKEEALEAKKKFLDSEGDHITFLNMYKMFIRAKGHRPQWCEEHFVNYKSMKKVQAIRKQLSLLCQEVEIRPCSCHDTSQIRKCIATGLFMNTAAIEVGKTDKSYKTVDGKKTVYIHPSSFLFSRKWTYIAYTELVETTKCYMRNNIGTNAMVLKQVAPEYFVDKRHVGVRIINHY